MKVEGTWLNTNTWTPATTKEVEQINKQLGGTKTSSIDQQTTNPVEMNQQDASTMVAGNNNTMPRALNADQYGGRGLVSRNAGRFPSDNITEPLSSMSSNINRTSDDAIMSKLNQAAQNAGFPTSNMQQPVQPQNASKGRFDIPSVVSNPSSSMGMPMATGSNMNMGTNPMMGQPQQQFTPPINPLGQPDSSMLGMSAPNQYPTTPEESILMANDSSIPQMGVPMGNQLGSMATQSSAGTPDLVATNNNLKFAQDYLRKQDKNIARTIDTTAKTLGIPYPQMYNMVAQMVQGADTGEGDAIVNSLPQYVREPMMFILDDAKKAKGVFNAQNEMAMRSQQIDAALNEANKQTPTGNINIKGNDLNALVAALQIAENSKRNIGPTTVDQLGFPIA